jgi:methylthioribulose-1-phosphate dehydratase
MPATVHTDEFCLRANELIEAGRYLHSRNWVPATSGNFSARLADGRIAITMSGRHKGFLTPDDIMLVDKDGAPLDGKKPSAETGLHIALYRRFPDVNAVLHPHTINSVLASRLFRDELLLEDHELLKALRGIETHETRLKIPIFPNDQDIGRLASRVDKHLQDHGNSYGYIIAGHGFYTWGETVTEALRHLEALDFLFDLEIRLYGVRKS